MINTSTNTPKIPQNCIVFTIIFYFVIFCNFFSTFLKENNFWTKTRLDLIFNFFFANKKILFVFITSHRIRYKSSNDVHIKRIFDFVRLFHSMGCLSYHNSDNSFIKDANKTLILHNFVSMFVIISFTAIEIS